MYLIKNKQSQRMYATKNMGIVSKITGVSIPSLSKYMTTRKNDIYDSQKWVIQKTKVYKGSDIDLDFIKLDKKTLTIHRTTKDRK